MSEGVHRNVASVERFWAERWHYVADALVRSGAMDIDGDEYEANKRALERFGLPRPLAARISLGLGAMPVPSACKVNPW